MTRDPSSRLRQSHNELIKLSQSWASGRRFDPIRAGRLREEAILLNHAHCVQAIPVYRRLAQETGRGEPRSIQDIERYFMSSDDIFKSYDPRWLDEGRFDQMNLWLTQVFHRPVQVNVQGIESIDDWIERLGVAGIHTVYSSGTSGAFSFVPREQAEWSLARTANICYLTALLSHQKVRNSLADSLRSRAGALLSPDAFAGLVDKVGLREFDCVFLGFNGGRMGNQALIQELGPIFGRRLCLYEAGLSASALHRLRRGVCSEQDRELVERFQAETVGKREQNFERIVSQMKASATEGRKVFLFGAPYQFSEMCRFMSDRRERVPLNAASLILFGGGWKSFAGEEIEREALVASLADSFGLPQERILEGYSMTEMSALILRCDSGRFHIPPLMEPALFDEELRPIEGGETSGVFGFLDPFAVSRPGFVISGDQVTMIDGECACGLSGPALTRIGRARGREVKGCGGIMGSIRA
ncbi:MAG: hypothetical protein Q7T04_03175 [Dehalococcoidia bacterium]|nr:hypothetical protein [Dehalococcoidia bacterium]